MKIRKIATITILVLSSFAANTVAPSKAELESMYDKAFREFNANNYPQALKELDAIDARQPDLAESQNLRGVIRMRQAQYDQAEEALQKALATDPKFWNARFNLAEIPFLRKNWAEARNRFQALLNGNASELQGEAAQLIQYKILLTYLLEGKENMVDSILAKFELSPDTPAVHYSNAAIALQHKNEKEAKDWLTAAEKNFSPQLNKLFAESLYEVGWLEKPAGQSRAAVELTSAAERAAKAKAFAKDKFEQAEQAFQQRDFTAARKLVDEADAADPNQAATINLRGEILLGQKDFDGAENAFKQAAKVDPKLREAQYNLAQIPFKKKEYAKARDRFEALYTATPAPGGDKNQAAQIIKFKIYLTLLLEGKDSRAQKMMEQFQFTGDTPALYYAQAAWEFKHNNPSKANDWVVSARKIYSPALNYVFAESFYDLGWLQNLSASPATAVADNTKAETTPAVEPSPIAGAALALNNKTAKQAASTVPQTSPAAAVVPGMEATTANTAQSPAASQAVMAKTDKSTAPGAVAAVSPTVETSPAAAGAPVPREPEKVATAAVQPVTAGPQQNPAASAPAAPLAAASVPQPNLPASNVPQVPVAAASVTQQSAPASRVPAPVAAVSAPAAPGITNRSAATPATVLAPATVAQQPKPTVSEPVDRFANSRNYLVGALLVAGMLLLTWVVVSELRRRVANVAVYRAATPATGPRLDSPAAAPPIVVEKITAPSRLLGGPPQVSLQLKASEPSVRRGSVPFGKPSRGLGNGVAAAAPPAAAPETFTPKEEASPEESSRWAEPIVEEPVETVSAIVDAESGHQAVTPPSVLEKVAEPEARFAEPEFSRSEPEVATRAYEDLAEPVAAPLEAAQTFEPEAVFEKESVVEQETAFEPEAVFEPEPVVQQESAFEAEPAFESEPAFEPEPAFEAPPALAAASALAAVGAFESPASFEAVDEPRVATPSETASETVSGRSDQFAEFEVEPVAQGQPIPYQVPASSTISPMAEVTKPESESRPSPGTEGTPARAGIAGVGALRQSVESPSFAPKVISTEPLAQQPTTPATMPQPTQTTPAPAIRPNPMTGGAPQAPAPGGMHTAVQLTFSFEIASLQLTPSFKMGALQLKPTSKIVTMRLAPSQQPQPAMNLQVTFEVATVQLAGGALGTIRLTPSQQQRPSVISSPAFNIASLQVLSGAESGALQLTPSQQGQASVHVTGRFQIATVEFSPSFEISSLVLNSTSKSVSVQLPGAGPSAIEGAPIFEIANVQLGGGGEIGMMQLVAPGTPSRPA